MLWARADIFTVPPEIARKNYIMIQPPGQLITIHAAGLSVRSPGFDLTRFDFGSLRA
jgi:hypothetical protein